MKSEKGITLVTLVLYIIVLLIVVGVLNSIHEMFYANLKHITNNSKNVSEFNKFNMYFIEDVKNNRNAQVSQSEIIFDDGTKYTYSSSDNGIYRNKVKICNSIQQCSFLLNEDDDIGKKIIKVNIEIKSSNQFKTENDYVLRYW